MFPQVGGARNNLLFCTVRRNLKLFLLMQVYAWMEFPLLISGIWLLKCCILLSTKQRNPKRKCRETCCVRKHQENTPPPKSRLKIPHNYLEVSNVDCVSSNVKSSQFGAMLYLFEDNEAVIKMIIKGRSPTMRHVSRTHRVALICLHEKPTRRDTDKR